jgi:predicted nucleic acid-binding protein
MRQIFADTVYCIALANPHDQWHPLAVQAGRSLRGTTIVTSEEILTEFLTHFSGQGRLIREAAVRYAERVQILSPSGRSRRMDSRTRAECLKRSVEPSGW